jgi:hypothetical protein
MMLSTPPDGLTGPADSDRPRVSWLGSGRGVRIRVMADKRFLSGALIVAVIVVAGASALPALLLGSAPSDAPAVIVAAAPLAVAQPAKVEPIEVVAPAAPAAAAIPTVQVDAPEPAAPVPVRESQPELVPTPEPSVVQTTAFPPVQPIGIPVPSTSVPAASAAAPAANTASPAAKKAERRALVAAAREVKRKRRTVRPAPFSIRELFAWRR